MNMVSRHSMCTCSRSRKKLKRNRMKTQKFKTVPETGPVHVHRTSWNNQTIRLALFDVEPQGS